MVGYGCAHWWPELRPKLISALKNAIFEVLAVDSPALAWLSFERQDLRAAIIAAAFALGREHIIPEMFRALLDKMNISRQEAEVFHYYLDRHIELDGDHHGPMSLRMLDLMCEGDEVKIAEAENAALEAVKARIKFWDGVLLEIQNHRTKSA